MSARSRTVVVALVMAAALAVPCVAMSSAGKATTSDRGLEAVAPARTQRLAPPAPDLRNLRTMTTVPTGELPLVVMIVLVLAGIVGRYLRRIGDIGDDWRSLLEGAPPALR